MSDGPLLIAVALGLELRPIARALAGLPEAIRTVRTGPGIQHADTGATAALAEHRDLAGIVCAGLCGALDPALSTGIAED